MLTKEMLEVAAADFTARLQAHLGANVSLPEAVELTAASLREELTGQPAERKAVPSLAQQIRDQVAGRAQPAQRTPPVRGRGV